MNSGLLHRMVILLAVCLAGLTFLINLLRGCDFFYAIFWAMLVLFAAAIIMLIAMKNVASVLLQHLQQKQKARRELLMEEARKKEEAERFAGKQKQAEKASASDPAKPKTPVAPQPKTAAVPPPQTQKK